MSKKEHKMTIMTMIEAFLIVFFAIFLGCYVTSSFTYGSYIQPYDTTNNVLQNVNNESKTLKQIEYDNDFYECIYHLPKQYRADLIRDENKLKDALTVCKMVSKKIEKDSPVKYTQIANMNTPMGNAHPLSLRDGRILVYGGCDLDNYSLEVFNPATNTFKLITNEFGGYVNLPMQRSPFILPDGKVFFYDAIFNPKTDSISILTDKKHKQMAQVYRSFFFNKDINHPNLINYRLLEDGKILTLSDCKVSKNDSYCINLIDPVNNRQFKQGQLNVKRINFNVVSLKNENILLLGGFVSVDGNFSDLASIELYDPKTGKVTLQPKQPQIDSILNVYAMNQDNIIIFTGIKDGNVAYLFNIPKNKLDIIGRISPSFVKGTMFGKDKVLFKDERYQKSFSREYVTRDLFHPSLVDLDNKTIQILYNISIEQGLISLPNGKILLIGGPVYEDKVYKYCSNNAALLEFK